MTRPSRRNVLGYGLILATAVSMSVSMTACSADADSSTGPTTPHGYTLTEVPGFGISLAVPSDWTTLTHDDLDDELVQAVADALDQEPDSVRENAQTFHLISVDADATDFTENLVVSQYQLEDGLPPEEEFAEVTADDQVDSSDFVQRTTGSGAEAALYTASGKLAGSGRAFSIAFMAIMTGGATGTPDTAGSTEDGTAASTDPGGTVTFVMIDAASAERAREIADAVLASL
ncbi:hypothetical protein [Actinomyces sp.]|uniref:hypothetical protein n=1 Tax=Actinomyces sp. TaxID=29317 RepID=UPI0026DBD9FC|nr:hypothetical protein [Actinomyces sp.]MDO4901778.1 hypothetical protein [Actinomyces sp.]